ncbi:MAG: PLP-dependent aminotransferase family protein [Clostridia bacterium]|nr:PLP-dependent aminotransferase family protein [Clostridia bacterium]
MNSIFNTDSSEPVYLQLYNHFRSLILSGALKSQTRLPSIRKCAETYGVSKTTVEAAYVQLELEGCIYSVPQSGFYVADMPDFTPAGKITPEKSKSENHGKAQFDFTSSAADKESFDFNLWQRYVKSALRTGTRLLDYGDPQGEEDLRRALCSYVSKSRGIICGENQIVIGAGVQNLLQLLCALEKERKCVKIMGKPYKKGEAVFTDYGKSVENVSSYSCNDFSCGMIYTSPSHINYKGDVLSLSKRIDLLKHARENDCLIIEDDYDSEFSYTGRPVPSLRSLDGGERVVYIGTFSKLLLPSIRISFMVLTNSLTEKYEKIRELYNQTASKTEQIALCRYISDGHLDSRIKRTKKLYADKTRRFYNGICENKNEKFKISISHTGFSVSISGKNEDVDSLLCFFQKENMRVNCKPTENEDEKVIVLSVSAISSEQIDFLAKKVCECIKKYKSF